MSDEIKIKRNLQRIEALNAMIKQETSLIEQRKLKNKVSVYKGRT